MPQVAGPAVASFDARRIAPVRVGDCGAQAVLVIRRDNQMHMVQHQALRPDLRPGFPDRCAQQIEVGLMVAVVEKHLAAPVATLRDMMWQAGSNKAGDARHGAMLRGILWVESYGNCHRDCTEFNALRLWLLRE